MHAYLHARIHARMHSRLIDGESVLSFSAKAISGRALNLSGSDRLIVACGTTGSRFGYHGTARGMVVVDWPALANARNSSKSTIPPTSIRSVFRIECEARCEARCNRAGVCGIKQFAEGVKRYCECHDGYYCDAARPLFRDGLCSAVADAANTEIPTEPPTVRYDRQPYLLKLQQLPLLTEVTTATLTY